MEQVRDTPLQHDPDTGIFYRQWDVPRTSVAFILIHGLGGHSGRWQAMGDYFQAQGIASYALELKGFGETQSEEGHVDSFEVYRRDIASLCRMVQAKGAASSVYLLGESLGALIAFEAACHLSERVRGCVCVAPAFKGKLRFGFLRFAGILLSLLYDRRKQFALPFDAGMCTRDQQYQRQINEDAREVRVVTSGMLWNICLAQAAVLFRAKRFDLPTLFLLSGQDKLVDNRATRYIYSRLKTADKTLIEYSDMYHALSIDLGREKIFQDVDQWVRARE
jgi:alpha-beta hydrolase superfamily lysophospholipase